MAFDLARARELYQEGYSIFAIAQLMNYSEGVVKHRLKNACVKMRPRGPKPSREPDPDPWEGEKPNPKPKMVRCLGPLCWGEKTFLSRDPANQRRCPACQEAVKSIDGAGILGQPGSRRLTKVGVTRGADNR